MTATGLAEFSFYLLLIGSKASDDSNGKMTSACNGYYEEVVSKPGVSVSILGHL